ncbi:MAG: hypothetical protein JO040_03520 [Gemmatimonadetes bacterium]|nr:hypothetical protein [Gemmatimonadota bacterium]
MAEIPIDEMEPGSELDELVAKRVLGWKRHRRCPGEIAHMPTGWRCRRCGKMGDEGAPTEHEERPPRCSTSIVAAWRVVERFAHEGVPVEVSANPTERGPEPWCAVIRMGEVEHTAGGETAPAAICRVALKARGEG